MDRLGFGAVADRIRGGAFGQASRQAKADALDDTRTWIDPRGRALSDRLWSARASDRAAIERILREGIAAGEDPLAVARRLEVYLTPEGRRLTTTTPPIRRGTPEEYRSGRGSYAARRLARTEITRAHGQATIQAAARNPFVVGVRWNLSPSHPKVDICDEHAGRDVGLGRGVYPVEAVPRYPAHPHCLCNLSPVVAEDAIQTIVAQARREAGSPTENIPVAAQGRRPGVSPLGLLRSLWGLARVWFE